MTAGLDRLIAEATVLAAGEHQCAVLGHRWQFVGGRNAGCERGDYCSCSVPVHECECGDCDYGDNPEADEIMADCREERR